MSGAYSLNENTSLIARNGFRVPSRAEIFIDVRKESGLVEVMSMPYLRSAPVLVLGEGSNTLLVGDVPGVVISVGALGREIIEDQGSHVVLRVAAGEHWDDVVRWTLGLGLAGLENLVLIPGTMGAAPIQNIGAYGTEVGEFIDAVTAFDRTTQQSVRLNQDECLFGYRDSLFKQQAGRWLITSVDLRLPRTQTPRISYPGIPEELEQIGAGDAPRPSRIAEAITRLRTRKLPNPNLLPNVGSFFRNPVVSNEVAELLQREHPNLVTFSPSATQRKVSAAWLIEQSGWKGFREGDAGVSEQHALVLVNYGNATGHDILDLARRVSASVEQRFGIALEPEARIIGATW